MEGYATVVRVVLQHFRCPTAVGRDGAAENLEAGHDDL